MCTLGVVRREKSEVSYFSYESNLSSGESQFG
jgi:hypothetical protein